VFESSSAEERNSLVLVDLHFRVVNPSSVGEGEGAKEASSRDSDDGESSDSERAKMHCESLSGVVLTVDCQDCRICRKGRRSFQYQQNHLKLIGGFTSS
jgi:hypothetical protein